MFQDLIVWRILIVYCNTDDNCIYHRTLSKGCEIMIIFEDGDLLKSGTNVIAHQVNCKGVMGSRWLKI